LDKINEQITVHDDEPGVLSDTLQHGEHANQEQELDAEAYCKRAFKRGRMHATDVGELNRAYKRTISNACNDVKNAVEHVHVPEQIEALSRIKRHRDLLRKWGRDSVLPPLYRAQVAVRQGPNRIHTHGIQYCMAHINW